MPRRAQTGCQILAARAQRDGCPRIASQPMHFGRESALPIVEASFDSLCGLQKRECIEIASPRPKRSRGVLTGLESGKWAVNGDVGGFENESGITSLLRVHVEDW